MPIDFIIRSCFFGFGIFSIIYVLTCFPFFKKNSLLISIDQSAITTIKYVGLFFFFYWLFSILSIYFGSDVLEKENLLNRMNGKYWFSLFGQLILYLISSQLFWIPKLEQKLILRFILGIVAIFDFEKFVILSTSFQRDYLPSSWTMYSNVSFLGIIISNWIVEIIIFASFVTVTYYLKNRKKL